ncbi:SAM-dependent methyltransferase [Mycobacterium sp. 1165196.3]|uniref:class I SAM-dependent methyltransferase n=1 Tax=unclassified Mycobacterium TaxID=2642494 RepID=UPI0008008B5B|nr:MULTISPECIES: class I SAM-dependent methyltransferase [unclassified Mycobacterium]OBJ04959.1 SAM-dependent methyltransferase [Mycobacterium sp. 1482292.6]OBJ20894.1 SAM-dependent methyltransferase [Mycobacterium sp. 1245801.1]OBK39760.1 SAM-dependent methyltransferase [Mycobacterium sp. 1165196.3]OBL00428.1 SAM-dependent methyltransferase [Mycobacterium sp. 1245499.0]
MARTDDDTWDLATSVGATATMVAAGRARATRDGLIDDRFAEPLVRAVGVDFMTRWAAGELDSADVDEPGAPWGMQRMTDMLAARTRYIDAFFAEAGAQKDPAIDQVVILASGLDARAYRLAWAPGTTVFEIDQPQVLEFKAATIAELGAQPTAEVRAVPIDLRHDWPAALRQAGFDTGRPAAWAAEGLVGFLPPEAQDRLLDNVTALSADGSQLVAEVFANTGINGDALNAASEKWRRNGLDIALGELGFPGERNDVATYLQQRGWQPVRTPLNQLLANAGLPLQSTDPDAPFAQNYYCTAVLNKTG